MITTIKYRPIDLLRADFDGYDQLNEFWFSAVAWKTVGHDTIMRIAEDAGFSGLHALEGGFDDCPYGGSRDFNDARYGSKGPMMKLWKCGMQNNRFWLLRTIFRICEIATFDTERECIEFMLTQLKAKALVNLKDQFKRGNIVYDYDRSKNI